MPYKLERYLARTFAETLARRAKLGASYWVQVPVGKGLEAERFAIKNNMMLGGKVKSPILSVFLKEISPKPIVF